MTIQNQIDNISKEQYEDLYIKSFSISKLIQSIGLNDTVHVRTRVVAKLEQIDLFNINKYSDDIIVSITSTSNCYNEICDKLNLIKCNININAVRTKQEQLKCNIDHLYKNKSKIINAPVIKPITPDGYKSCNACNQILSIDCFRKNKDIPGGFHYNCKLCSNQKNNKRLETHVFQQDRMKYTSNARRQLNTSVMRGIKTHLGCMYCGENSHPCVLEYHHVNDDKDITIGQQNSRKLSVLMDEVKKCICLCANCHRKVHAGVINVDHIPIITSDVIDKIIIQEQINLEYELKNSPNTQWVYNNELDLQMKIPVDFIDEYINNGYVLHTRRSYRRGNKRTDLVTDS